MSRRSNDQAAEEQVLPDDAPTREHAGARRTTMDWWTPPMDPTPWTVGASPATFLFYWAIPAVAVALFLLQTNWEAVHQLRRQRRFMGEVDPLRARELDREDQRLRLDAWRRAVLIVFTSGAFVIVGGTVSTAISMWLRAY